MRQIEDAKWLHLAECNGEDPNLFYGFEREDDETRLIRVRTAKDICRQCKVKRQCLTTALNNQETFGIWGGLTEAERWRLIKASRTESA